MLYKKIGKMLYSFIKENKCTLFLLVSLFFYTTDAYAVFESLQMAGNNIFKGIVKIIYPAATIGLACVCIAGMFGNFNWKWLAAIMLGVFVIALASSGNPEEGADMFAGEGIDNYNGFGLTSFISGFFSGD
jgi:hypothetical protein